MVMIVVLRLGHRPLRDKRITTHVALTARALGAQGMVMDVKDEKVEQGISKVVKNWGGNFFVRTVDWEKYVKEWDGLVVHLTMYGLPIDEVLPRIRENNILVVVGSKKVPRKIFSLADYNIAIGNQPHSEVGALAIFLDRFLKGKGLKKEFGGRLKVFPSEKSKLIQKI
jgi:tRNA (cytidine56-2'-O)-methyltransferase